MILGLTGGMGSGKSTTLKILGEIGFALIDSDAVIRREILTHPEVEQAVLEHFGKTSLTAEGRVDRAVLARLVFNDDAARHWLEGVIHPRLYAIWRERLTTEPGRSWVVEVPLLFEQALENWFDFTVCVATTSLNQFARLAERGLNKALAEQRISKQLPLAHKLELADFVLSNDGTTDFLRDQIIRLVAQLSVIR